MANADVYREGLPASSADGDGPAEWVDGPIQGWSEGLLGWKSSAVGGFQDLLPDEAPSYRRGWAGARIGVRMVMDSASRSSPFVGTGCLCAKGTTSEAKENSRHKAEGIGARICCVIDKVRSVIPQTVRQQQRNTPRSGSYLDVITKEREAKSMLRLKVERPVEIKERLPQRERVPDQ